jgi:membrane protease subunit HflK
MLTGDLNVIDVQWIVQYRIEDPERYLFQVREQGETLRDVAEAVMRRVVGNRLGSDVLTVGRAAVATEVKEEMQKILLDYQTGIRIITVELQDVTPPDPVKPAFNEVNEARQDRERMINQAQEQANKVIPKARGEAKQSIAEAEGYATERVNQAQGEATRFLGESRGGPKVHLVGSRLFQCSRAPCHGRCLRKLPDAGRDRSDPRRLQAGGVEAPC